MAPTICSGKKRQTRTIATTNIRRHGQQGSLQLNQALTNIVKYVAKSSLNPSLSASLRIQTGTQIGGNSNTNSAHYIEESLDTYHTSTSTSNNHHRQQFSFISDNAVTSSTHSDTENTFDLRLAHEILINNSTTISEPSTSLSTSLTSSLSLSESTQSSSTSTQNERTSSSKERTFHRYSIKDSKKRILPGPWENDFNGGDDNENGKTNQIHSNNNIRKHYYDYNDFDTEEEYSNEEFEEEGRDLHSDVSQRDGSDTDMDTDEADSMTSLDTEKSAKLKRGNHPLLRDKLLAKQKTTNSDSNIRNTDGLLSIAIKTIKLVKRNQLLQQRLTQLQLETSEFIQSVLANPENRHFRENIKQTVQEVDNA
ncbi:clock interacting protein circadian isoform 1-T2 [Cochliomyia hominivorax]